MPHQLSHQKKRLSCGSPVHYLLQIQRPCKGVSFYHGGQEQRALGSSNFKFVANPGDYPNCFMYIEHRTWLKESV